MSTGVNGPKLVCRPIYRRGDKIDKPGLNRFLAGYTPRNAKKVPCKDVSKTWSGPRFSAMLNSLRNELCVSSWHQKKGYTGLVAVAVGQHQLILIGGAKCKRIDQAELVLEDVDQILLSYPRAGEAAWRNEYGIVRKLVMEPREDSSDVLSFHRLLEEGDDDTFHSLLVRFFGVDSTEADLRVYDKENDQPVEVGEGDSHAKYVIGLGY